MLPQDVAVIISTRVKNKKKGQPEKDVASEHFTSCNMLLC